MRDVHVVLDFTVGIAIVVAALVTEGRVLNSSLEVDWALGIGWRETSLLVVPRSRRVVTLFEESIWLEAEDGGDKKDSGVLIRDVEGVPMPVRLDVDVEVEVEVTVKADVLAMLANSWCTGYDAMRDLGRNKMAPTVINQKSRIPARRCSSFLSGTCLFVESGKRCGGLGEAWTSSMMLTPT